MMRVEGLHVFGNNVRMLDQFRAMRRKDDVPALTCADLAFTGQLVFNEICGELLVNLRALGLSDNLALSGGCALNSSWNGKIAERVGFEQLFVNSAPADDGNAVGAAWLAYYEDHPAARPPRRVQSPYLGESMHPSTLDNLGRFGGLTNALAPGIPIHERAAELLAEGKIVGWVQGRAEFGPRALGNRSILADPRRSDIKDVINARVKFREEFRPFAPSILHEHGDEYFEHYQESPYMERALRFRPEVVDRVPGVVHVDGTGRLQSVRRENNPRFYDLIRAFKTITGIPVLLNTSFNIMGKPIIHSVEDAVAVFFTSGLDALVIDDQLFLKSTGSR
jgi:carbamoyltransferase